MTGASPHVTVVLPTHRRPDSLGRAVAGLARQRDPGVPWDVVVVDNDLPPGSAAAVVARGPALPVPVRVVLESNLGSAHARNRGIDEAAGSIVAFLDDDVEPADDWLARLLPPLLAGECEAVGGRVLLDRSVPIPRWLPDWLLPYLAEFDPSPVAVDITTLSPPLSEPYVLTANAAFDAGVLARAGGFDPLLGPRQGVPIVNDDLSLCRRALATGARIRYVPAAQVVHELPASRLRRRYFARRLYAQGRSDWLLDRDTLGSAPSAGAVDAVKDIAGTLLRAVRWRRVPTPRVVFLAHETLRRLGFLREAVAHLARRRRSG